MRCLPVRRTIAERGKPVVGAGDKLFEALESDLYFRNEEALRERKPII
jgi:hypothetical protein